jgi:hypothetical protein
MTALSDDTIVARVLLNVLDPSAEQLDACTKRRVVKRRRRGADKRSSTLGEHCRAATRPANVAIVARISRTAISVSWSDPCVGRFTEQIWSRAYAHDAAVCALTGRPIRRGEPVFRPHAGDACGLPYRELAILASTVAQRADPSSAGIRARKEEA